MHVCLAWSECVCMHVGSVCICAGTRNARGIAAYGHVAYNLGVAETNLVLRIA